jgi:3-hydroxymyristoyl/3-hydroxydecanoyl-(acyl carrier protein) dehydratase
MDKLGSTAGRGSGVARVNGKVACEAAMLFVVVRV